MSTHRITSHDVARLVGVSQSTVSRALRGHPAVTAATTERVRAGAEQLGHFPNLAARSLMTARTQTIGVVVANITNPFYPQLVEVLHDDRRGGYRTVLVNTDQDPGALLRGGVDGAVLVSPRLWGRRLGPRSPQAAYRLSFSTVTATTRRSTSSRATTSPVAQSPPRSSPTWATAGSADCGPGEHLNRARTADGPRSWNGGDRRSTNVSGGRPLFTPGRL